MNANDATLIELATAQSGSTIADNAPNAPAGGTFDLVLALLIHAGLGHGGAPDMKSAPELGR